MDVSIEENFSGFIRELIKNGSRIDDRDFFEYRKIEIIKNYSKNAEGSCYLKLGKTQVLAGVKLEITEPFPDTPDEGILVVNLEFLPASHPEVQVGPPDDKAIEYARVVDRAIRESEFIKTKELVIEPGKYVWVIYLDIYVLNDDGNIIDASTLASICALMNTKFPSYEKVNDNYIINQKMKTDKSLPLNLDRIPMNVTFAKIDDKFLVDPCRGEELAADLIVHIGLSDSINSLQLEKSGMISLDEMDYLIENARKIRSKLIKKLQI